MKRAWRMCGLSGCSLTGGDVKISEGEHSQAAHATLKGIRRRGACGWWGSALANGEMR